MSTVVYNPKPKAPLLNAIRYALKCEIDGAPSHKEGLCGDAKECYQVIKSYQEFHGYEGKQKYRSVIYSFSESEAKSLTMPQMMEIGVEFSKRAFKGHQFVMGMHNDTKKPHFHILFNIVHPETGKLIQNKLEVKRLRALNDQILKEKGLTPLSDRYKSKDKNVQKEIRDNYNLESKRHKYSTWSFVKDLKQKATFAREVSTNFDEYADNLKLFDIKVRVGKHVTYFYPDRKIGMRGKYLSDELDHKGLLETFNKNKERFVADPFLKVQRHERFKNALENKNDLSVLTNAHSRDFSLRNSASTFSSPSREKFYFDSPFHDEFKTATRYKSLFDYVDKHKIKTIQKDERTRTLVGRDHIQIKEDHWINTKNKTRGNLIDFVAIHQNLSFIEAISKVNNNPRLLLSLKHLDQGLTYKSFYVPKEKRKGLHEASFVLQSFGRKHQIRDDKIDYFQRSKQLQVNNKGDIFLFGESEFNGALKFLKEGDGSYRDKSLSKPKGLFFYHSGRSKKLKVFLDAMSFLERDESMKTFRNSHDSVAVLFGSQSFNLDKVLASNAAINEIEFIKPKNREFSTFELKLMNKTKRRYKDLDLSFATGKELNLEQSRSRGFELSL